jgi:hypothetical protein
VNDTGSWEPLVSVGHCFVSTSIYCFWFGIFKLFLYQAASY